MHECHFKYGKTIGNISCGSFGFGVLLHNNVNNFDIEESAIGNYELKQEFDISQ